jgi:hypothetical protein
VKIIEDEKRYGVLRRTNFVIFYFAQRLLEEQEKKKEILIDEEEKSRVMSSIKSIYLLNKKIYIL